MKRHPDRLWAVVRGPGTIAFPITCEEAAEAFRKAGWNVIEVELSAIPADASLRCLGIEPPERDKH